jgi:membrane fusion protein (multidrug efflux system)
MPAALRPFVRSFALVLTATIVAGCGQSQQKGAGGFHGFPPAEVTVVAATPKNFPVTFEYVGQTQGSKDVEVRARVTGIIEKRLFDEGARVKAGQPLFIIDARQYQAQVAAANADVARAQAQKAQADRELARLRPLAERKAIGQKEADDAASNADLANAAVKAAQAKVSELSVNLGYTKVVAPITGLTSRALKSEGSLATANDTLLTIISQTDPIWVIFSISENEQLRLNRAAAANQLALPKDNAYEVTIKLSDGSTLPRKGRINFSDTRINPTTGTYEMRAEVANPDGALKPGQFVRVILQGAERQNVIAVPQVAVMDGPQGKFVYVVGKDKEGKDIAMPRPVVVGDWVDANASNQWVIESGLKAGEPVIVNGIAKVMPGAQVKVATAGAEAGGTPGAPAGAAGAGAGAAGASAAGAGAAGGAGKGEAPAANASSGANAPKAAAPTSGAPQASGTINEKARGGDVKAAAAQAPAGGASAASGQGAGSTSTTASNASGTSASPAAKP